MKIILLLRFISLHRSLLIEHVRNYAALFSEQAKQLLADFRNKIILGILCLCFALISVILSGVGLMLWAVLPSTDLKVSWILVATPLIPAAIAVWCGWMASRNGGDAFSELKRQVNEDVKLFQQKGSI